MILKFRVYEQTISLQSTKSEPRQGSKDYLELQFSFSPDWNDLLKYVYIQHGEVSVPHDLVDGSVIVDEYFTEQTEFSVTLFGKSADGSIEVPTNVVTVFLNESNNLWEKDAPAPQNSWFVQVADARDEALAAAIRAENAAIHQPYPNEETGTWWVWSAETGKYEDTGESYGVGGGTSDHTKLSNRDAADQHPMSAITGLEDALDSKQPTGNYITEELDPTVPEWAKQPKKPAYTAQEVGALPDTTHIPSTAEDVNAEPSGAVSQHNVSDAAHSDIRMLIQGLSERLSAVADSDDTTLDQLSEIVAYIKSNRDLISSITTDKVSVADIVDNLTTNVAKKPLSAAQGVALKALIDAITVPTALSELTEDETHRVVTDSEKAEWNAKSNFTGSYNDLTDKPTIPEAYTLPIASSTVLGGVQPVAKTDAMTQSVGVDAAGGLWAPPGSGGTAEREWTMLGEIDISVVGGGNIELTDLDNFTEFYATWETVINESTTASGYYVSINGVSIAKVAIPIQKAGSSSSYGWMIARYNGLVWECQRSGGAIAQNNVALTFNSGLFPYNLLLDVGKATKFQLLAPLPNYQAVSGIITIYGR